MELLFLILIITAICLIYLKNKNSLGKKGENEISRLLKKQKGKLINSLKLPLYDGMTEIDHILIKKNAIFIVETKNISGSVKGQVGDKNLTHTIGSKIHKLYNPVFQNKTHCDNIIHHLKKGGFYPVDIYSIVCFSSDNISIDIKGKSNTIILKKDKLNQYINSVSNKNQNVPVKQIYLYLKSIQEKNIIKLLMHNRRIRKLNRQ